jgi:hypothetical protein
MDGRRVTLLVLWSVVFAGCVSYATRIEMSPSNSGEPRLSDAEIAEVTTVVGGVATQFGFHSNPSLAELRRTSEESKEYDQRVVADYLADRDGKTHGRVILTVGIHKQTGQLTVLIRDRGSFRSTEFTSSLEEEITKRLGTRYSPNAIKVERGAVGPDLGP